MTHGHIYLMRTLMNDAMTSMRLGHAKTPEEKAQILLEARIESEAAGREYQKLSNIFWVVVGAGIVGMVFVFIMILVNR